MFWVWKKKKRKKIYFAYFSANAPKNGSLYFSPLYALIMQTIHIITDATLVNSANIQNNTPKIGHVLEFLINMNYIFVAEKGYKKMKSKDEIINTVNSMPINSTGFKAANFILLNDELVYNRLRECITFNERN